MPFFHPGLVALGYPEPVGFPLHARRFVLHAVDFDPHGVNKVSARTAPPEIFRETRCPQEILIEAASREVALQANYLLWASLAVVDGGSYYRDIYDIEQTMVGADEPTTDGERTSREACQVSGVLLACEVASKASFRRRSVYALTKWQLAATMWSMPSNRSQFSRGLLLRPASLSVMNVAWTGRSRMNRFAR